MRAVSGQADLAAMQISRSDLRDTEESFGTVLTDIARMLYPAPNTAAQIAVELQCSVRNVELCLSGKQSWSGDAIALFVAEIMRRHRMRNFRVTKR